MKKLKYRRNDGYLKSDGRSYVGKTNDDIVNKINEIVITINKLEKRIKQLENNSSFMGNDLTSLSELKSNW